MFVLFVVEVPSTASHHICFRFLVIRSHYGILLRIVLFVCDVPSTGVHYVLCCVVVVYVKSAAYQYIVSCCCGRCTQYAIQVRSWLSLMLVCQVRNHGADVFIFFGRCDQYGIPVLIILLFLVYVLIT